jgi:hypothetical protein
VLGAVLEGWRRVIHAPALTIGILLATFVCALPMGLVMKDSIERHLGDSLKRTRRCPAGIRHGRPSSRRNRRGLASTFTHEILGFGGTMAIGAAICSTTSPLTREMSLAVARTSALDLPVGRRARIRPCLAVVPCALRAFFAACGVYFMRFLPPGCRDRNRVLRAVQRGCTRFLFRHDLQPVHPRHDCGTRCRSCCEVRCI